MSLAFVGNVLLVLLLLGLRVCVFNLVDVLLHCAHIYGAVGHWLPLNIAHIVKVRLTCIYIHPILNRHTVVTLLPFINRDC
jgi:hypothetical protein